VKDGKVTTGDAKVRVQNYFHDKAPFGVVTSSLNFGFPDLGEGKATAEANLILLEIGTGANSELPAQK